MVRHFPVLHFQVVHFQSPLYANEKQHVSDDNVRLLSTINTIIDTRNYTGADWLIHDAFYT